MPLSLTNGLRSTIFSPNGDAYTGEWKDNQKHGRGIQIWKKSGATYEGEWKAGKRDGYGTYSVLLPGTQTHTRKYCGEWKNGKKHGCGIFYYSSSAVYEGEWSENCRSGSGRMLYESGDIYEGEWMNDKNHGKGILLLDNGNWYEGTWQDDKRNGKGKFYYADTGQLYDGLWVDGMAKCGTLSDFGRDQAPTPTKYPIPQVELVDMQSVLREAQSPYTLISVEDQQQEGQQKVSTPLHTRRE